MQSTPEPQILHPLPPPRVYMNGSPAPLYPSVGRHVVMIKYGEVVDVIFNNNPASSFNGNYIADQAPRTVQEIHPMHLHGHHFWVRGGRVGWLHGLPG